MIFDGTKCLRLHFRNGAKALAGDMHDPQSDKTRLDAIRTQREFLIDQIRQSERTIERSRELIERLDELLAGGVLIRFRAIGWQALL